MVRREDQEQAPKIKDLQRLLGKVESLLKELTVQSEKATKRAHTVDSKIEDLQKEMSKKGSQLAIKGLEAQIQSQKINFEAAGQVHGELAAELKSLKELPTASTHGSSESVTSREFEQFKQELTERFDDSNRTRKAEIEALRAQNNLIHVSTTLAQLESLDVLVDTHSRDINSIQDKHAALVALVDEKIAVIPSHEFITEVHKKLAEIQNRLAALETQPYTENQKEHATAELRSMLEELRREKTDQIEASHDLITREIEETKGKTAVLQSQVDALKKVPDQRDGTPTTISDASDAAKVIATLSSQVEELKLQVEKLQRKPTGHDEKCSSIEPRIQALKDELSSHDRMLSTLFSAQMSSQDREALQSARMLAGKMERAEHQHQWLRTRFDNLTTETLHRQIIGYIAPVLPRLEQGYVRLESKTENLENMVNEKFTKLEASTSDADNRSQSLEDSSTTCINKLQEQQDTLLKQFQEGRDSMREEIKELQDWRVEVEARDQKQNLEADAFKRRTGSSARSVRDSSTPRNKPVQPGSIQKASNADWVIGESDDDNDEIDLTNEDARDALVRSFQKPAEPRASPSERKRKRDTPSTNGDGGHQESGDDLSYLNAPRKRAQGKKIR
ncbi:hypothetical protein LTR84_004066 [Exophiala bonariae]|uniref:Paramyosin n=1 Tax=Exophiala bonariae TaxID=1690606 RepID=A0AAV9N597_9EURO|nr:hypothetical protein LTR84_004066 [Exophiala bonariae]